jgi:16S rRNA C967 or C1407 C5-methylase (RsmB/RsmF family)
MIPDAFHTFYRSQYGNRWESLLHALMQPPVRGLRLNGFCGSEVSKDEQLLPNILPCIIPSNDTEPRIKGTGLMDYYRMDPASILPAMALEVKSGDQVLDMCSAPGGKALILAESLGDEGHLTANEWSRARKEKLRHVLKTYIPDTMLAQIRVTGHDASKWGLYEPEQYNRILLDAPCSSERHVLHQTAELKKWKPSRSKQLAQRQYALLCSALMSCKPGGRIVYSTCSLSNLENDETIRRLLNKKGDRFHCNTDWIHPMERQRNSVGKSFLIRKQVGAPCTGQC